MKLINQTKHRFCILKTAATTAVFYYLDFRKLIASPLINMSRMGCCDLDKFREETIEKMVGDSLNTIQQISYCLIQHNNTKFIP